MARTLPAIVALCAMVSVAAAAAETKAPEAFRLSGPYVHDNLCVYLIHGPDRVQKDFITLQEGLERKVVVVHETGEVNELAVENKGDVDIYIQSGDIVKGGKQDRTFAMDVIVPPRSGKVPVQSFCVEAGRWRARGGEAVAHFASSEQALSSRQLKLAAKSSGRQEEVWNEVKDVQAKLTENVAQNVQSPQSATSLQLTLENDAVQKSIDAYIARLHPAVEGKDDVIGYAFAINGQINSADVYANKALFRKLWPKLIRASSVEAVAELKKDAKFANPTAEQIQASMQQAEQGKKDQKQVNARTQMVTSKSKDAMLFETRDAAAPADWIHRNYIRQDE